MKTLIKTWSQSTTKFQRLRSTKGVEELEIYFDDISLPLAVESRGGEHIFEQEDGSFTDQSGNTVFEPGDNYFDFGDYTYQFIVE